MTKGLFSFTDIGEMTVDELEEWLSEAVDLETEIARQSQRRR